ncbi:hypothetical protein PR048_011383 [Dryococelus australis]|uniref:Dishevelled protein domain-containing protein n=1 Tax=Dryococelus australis TaxID=614101 RepID=A0ABQ9HLT7_9NEOP|nr:hypothetical protein PR048_011383 [Dryococelus australis]
MDNDERLRDNGRRDVCVVNEQEYMKLDDRMGHRQPHFSKTVTEFLNVYYLHRWIGRGGPVPWPPWSHDLSPLVLSFRDCLKSLRINGHPKHQTGHGYESSSMMSSDLETTSFLESEDDASSRITTTTGRATNLSVDRQTLGTESKMHRRDKCCPGTGIINHAAPMHKPLNWCAIFVLGTCWYETFWDFMPSLPLGATVAEWLTCLPLTKEMRVQSLAGSLWIFACGMVLDDTISRWVFSSISHFCCTLLFWCCSILTLITLICSRDLNVKSRPNLFTHSFSPSLLISSQHSCQSISLCVVTQPCYFPLPGYCFTDTYRRVEFHCCTKNDSMETICIEQKPNNIPVTSDS